MLFQLVAAVDCVSLAPGSFGAGDCACVCLAVCLRFHLELVIVVYVRSPHK